MFANVSVNAFILKERFVFELQSAALWFDLNGDGRPDLASALPVPSLGFVIWSDK